MSEQNMFPAGWIEQLAPLLGASLPDFLHSYEDSPARGIRMRPGRAPLDECTDPIPWAKDGFYLPLDSLAGAMPAHEAGAYYLQEPSAMAAAAALAPQPGEKVLDLCAAPGGKSTQLAAYLKGEGLLVCNEPVPSRAQILARNIERMGVKNAIVVNHLPEELSPRWPRFFDKILVDAPCSGEGMFRRHPETRNEWQITSPAGCALRQLQILSHAAQMLRPGGTMAYSTCTFNTRENEGVMEEFLRRYPDFSLKPFSLPGLGECQGMMRLWPHKIRGEGHFVALLVHNGEGAAAPRKKGKPQKGQNAPALSKQEMQLASAFLQDQIQESLFPTGMFAGRVIMSPAEAPDLSGIKVLRHGLHLGEIRGKIFVPDHALALACTPKNPWMMDENAARAYQKGEMLPAPDSCRGWYVPTLDGLSLGWAKASDGQMKNHYPKGLRK